MNFLSTLEKAHASIKALHKEIDLVETHVRRMAAGNSETIPFDHSTDHNTRRYGKYNNVVYKLRQEMEQLEHRLPKDDRYANTLGWAMAFDEISRQ